MLSSFPSAIGGKLLYIIRYIADMMMGDGNRPLEGWLAVKW